jgi:exonuclease III
MSTPKYRVNWKFLGVVVVVVAAVAVGTHLRYRQQVGSQAGVLIHLADAAEAEGELGKAVSYLRRYLVLKAGGKDEDVERRREQLEKLTPIVARAAAESRDEIVVLGDFNSTSPTDREHLRLFAARTGLSWASEQLECTAYWNRREGKNLRDCPGTALDHVFTREPPRTIAAKGQCEDIGCDGGLLCPLSRFVVSDHCPVLTEL